ncbi:hypothetical protein mRhiFer1_009461 [Rhinolophus ferrumequinum]|uniref:Uncharacterized protein n=1 Tax=Rhinolophus ferrumequinum TaxID=59479 RepID=A0A7J7RJG4_RHIFE|nr:hypothetical protein mRhiFer1_009461 [Rhinolophus ferrumequinum]
MLRGHPKPLLQFPSPASRHRSDLGAAWSLSLRPVATVPVQPSQALPLSSAVSWLPELALSLNLSCIVLLQILPWLLVACIPAGKPCLGHKTCSHSPQPSWSRPTPNGSWVFQDTWVSYSLTPHVPSDWNTLLLPA